MKFTKNSTITYPFTAYYYGYLGDLGPDPKVYVNLFSMTEGQLIDVDTLVDILEIREVSNETLFVGTAYVNKLGNYIDAGDYRLKISVQTPSNIIELLYAPIEIEDDPKKFLVSLIGENEPSDNDIRNHMKNIVDPGIKTGFQVTMSSDSYFYNIGYGVLYTASGCRVEHAGTNKAVKVDPAADFQRVDAITLFYDETRLDREGKASSPTFRVLKGIEDGHSAPPTIPPNHTVIRYAVIPANTTSPSQIKLSNIVDNPGRRQFFNIPAVQVGDGTRSVFDFPVEFILGTTESYVDGVTQILGEDYEEVSSKLSKSSIEFIGEVPEPGQRVSLSGYRINGPYYDYDYSPYATPAPLNPATVTHSRAGLVGEFLGEIFVEERWVDTCGTTNGFSAPKVITPLKGWDGSIGHYAYMEQDRSMMMPNISTLLTQEFSVVAKIDLRETIQSINWMRLLSKGTTFNLYVVNGDVEASFILDYGAVRLIKTVPRWAVDLGIGTIAITRDTTMELKLQYNGDPVANAATPYVLLGSDAWILGQRPLEAPAPGIQGKLTKVLFYNRAITQLEINAV